MLLRFTEAERAFYESKDGVVGAQADICLKTDFIIKVAKAESESIALVREANALCALQDSCVSEQCRTPELLWCSLDTSGEYVLLFLRRYQDDAFKFVLESKPADVMKMIALQLAQGLLTQEQQGIVNTDIKDMNILGDFNNPCVTSIAIADYGKAVSPCCNDCLRLAKKDGQRDYNVSPEVREGKPHIKSDIWSAGVFLVECCLEKRYVSFQKALYLLEQKLVNDVDRQWVAQLANHYNAFQVLCILARYTPVDAYQAIKDTLYNDQTILNKKGFLSDFKELLIDMLNPDPELRPAPEALVRAWSAGSE